MNEIKQSTPSREENVARISFWGTIVMAVLLALLASYFANVLIRQLGPLVTYIGLSVFLLAPIVSVTSIVLVISRRQKLGLKLAFYATLALGIMAVALFQGRALSASLSVLVISLLAIQWLFPSPLRRQYLIVTAVTLILMWSLEGINPSWRIQMQAAKLGPVAAGLFGLILGVIVFLQARKAIAKRFLSLSLRVKLLVSVVSITGLALLVYGVIFLYRTQQSQTFWSNELQSTVQQQSQQQIINSVQFEANTSDQALSEIANAVQQLADYQATLFSKESYLGQGGYWDGNSKLILHAGGQYGNVSSDLANVFIPNTVPLSPALISELNTNRYLDFSAPAVLKNNPNVAAIYYTSANNFSVYYPNIDLISLVPADFDLTTQPFYTVATPKNDPEQNAKWTDPYQDPAGTGLIVTTSVPVYDQKNQFRGVMSADVQLSKISEQISTVKLGKNGFAFLIDPSGHILAMPEAGYKLFGVKPEVVPVGESPKTTILGLGSTDVQNITKKMVNGENGLATAMIENAQYYVAYAPLPVIGYSIGLIAPSAELDATYLAAREKIGQETQVTTRLSILILLVVLLAAGGVSLLLGQFLSTPLTRLTETATEVAKGNLNVKAEVQTSDEIGILASTFNTMTSRLQETLSSLEQRVADRTRNLELAAEVGRAVSQVRDLDVMLKDACDLILKEFNLYYVQVYLTDPAQTVLRLEAGTGNVGAQLIGHGHSLPLNTGSINGRAATEKRTVVISDTAQSVTFRQNPLLPETRGEMAVPLIVANEVVGVLDMQSREPGVLTPEALPAFEALAGQLAVAIQNANLLAVTELARAQVEAQARRLVRQGWNEHLDAIHKPEQLGFVFDRHKMSQLAETDPYQPEEETAISAPIAVTGESLGSLIVEIDDETRREQTNELVHVIARQVAQQIENLRLLESAERYRYEVEKAARLQTIDGWQKYMESRSVEGLGYLYDTRQVRAHGKQGDEDLTMFASPLKAREEMIGKVAVQGLSDEEQESVELVHAVAERLSAHIENLRLFEETRHGQLELDKRARQLAAVAAISTASSQQLEVDKLLSTVVHLTQRQFNLYHVHVFVYNEASRELQIMACGWQEGNENDGTHETSSIPLDKEQSLVARAARTGRAVIVNDVKREPDWLPNPLLPDTASEMAVPLIIGDRLLGVLDVQSERVNGFSEADANIQTTLASQVATAMQNARSFTQAQKQAEREIMLNVINQKIQGATSVEAVLQIAARELGHALGAPMTIAQLSMKDRSS
jgi:GAF domain-containing protein/HAMP domain-containing protein